MCRVLEVTPQGYRKWKIEKPYKHALLLAQIQEILAEHPLNKNYGVKRIMQALRHKFGYEKSLSTLRRVLRENNIKPPKSGPKGLTKADKKAQKSDDLIKRDFTAKRPNEKWVSDITEVKTLDGKLYISGILDCFDNSMVGLSMADNMQTPLVIDSFLMAAKQNKATGVIFHTDRGSQYTSIDFRNILAKYGVKQSMNSAAGRCHDNAKMESAWGRFKEELIYQTKTKEMSMKQVKMMIFRYFMGYWNNQRICSAIGGLPPSCKRYAYFNSLLLTDTAA